MNRNLVIKGFVAVLASLVIIASFVSFYGSAVPSAQPNVVMETLDPSLGVYEGMWANEIGRRFNNAVGVLVHGGDFVEGQWIVGTHAQPWKHVTPIQEIVRGIQKKYPGRTVVVLACNTGHLKLGIPGVFYAHSSVWCVPDRAIRAEMYQREDSRQTLGSILIISKNLHQVTRWEEHPDYVGNIFEFGCD